MEIKMRRLSILCFLCIGLISCTQKSSDETKISDSLNIETISLSSEQIIQTGIKTGSIKKQTIIEILFCNGTIEASPNQEAYVSVPINGYIKKILKRVDEYVKKGDVLAILEHPDYIDLQRDFLETKSQYIYYREDFKRQGELSLENATSIKKMQQAQKEFRRIEARYFALKKHLEFIGINADSLFVDKIKTSILLKSPISGYLTKSKGKIGQLCTPDKPVFQIVSNTDAVLFLQVPESEAQLIKKGQVIEFNTTLDQNKKYQAVLKSSTKSVDENNAVNLHAKIHDIDNTLMPGMYVKAKIIVSSDSVYAISNKALVKSNESYFIFIRSDSTNFIPRKIDIGKTGNDFSEIILKDSALLQAEIVTSGAYYLQSKLLEE